VTRIEDVSPVAVLASGDAPWPTTSARDRGYKFLGYQLDKQGRPAFRYQSGTLIITDFPEPVGENKEGTFRRTLKFAASGPAEGLYVRAATGSSIEPGPDGSYVVDKLWTVKVAGGVLRDSNGRKELVVPVSLKEGRGEVVIELKW
jgi:hypothetical protein